jgi:hypothetical protein
VSRKLTIRKRKNLLTVCTAALFISVTITLFSQDLEDRSKKMVGDDIVQAEKEAIQWLKAMIVPNEIVENPVPLRRRFMLSYLIPQDDPVYPYLSSRSFIYDDALGAAAFTMAGEYRYAEQVLGAMRRNLRDDGSFFFAYNTHNSWPNEEDHGGALVRTGAIAWAGYAATFYLTTRLKQNEQFIKEDRLAQNFLAMAEAIAGFLLKNQVIDLKDKRHGLVTGGIGMYDVRLQNQNSGPVEVYTAAPVSWISMEHNIDGYFFLRDLHRMTGKKEYLDAAELIKEGLLRLWSEQDGQLFRGIKGDGKVDKALPIDGASWASMFLSSIGEDKMAIRCLQTIQDSFFSRSKGISGYKPYYAETVYEDNMVNAYYFPDNPTKKWKDVEMIWIEGSFGVAAANVKAGNWDNAHEIIRRLLPLNVNGGFQYATQFIPYQFSVYPSVASTAWFVITVEIMKNDQINTLFWDK